MRKNIHIQTAYREQLTQYRQWKSSKLRTGAMVKSYAVTIWYGSYNFEEKTRWYFSREIDTFLFTKLNQMFMETLDKKVAIEKATVKELTTRVINACASQVAGVYLDYLDSYLGTVTEKEPKLIEFIKEAVMPKLSTEQLKSIQRAFAVVAPKNETVYNGLLKAQEERKEINKKANKALKAVREAVEKMKDNGIDNPDTIINNLRQLVTFGMLTAEAVDSYIDTEFSE